MTLLLVGFTCGLVLLIFMFFTMTLGAWIFIECIDVISMQGPTFAQEYVMSGYYNSSIEHALNLLAWILKLLRLLHWR